MLLKDLLYYNKLIQELARYNNLVVYVFWVKMDMSKENLFVGISI